MTFYDILRTILDLGMVSHEKAHWRRFRHTYAQKMGIM